MLSKSLIYLYNPLTLFFVTPAAGLGEGDSFCFITFMRIFWGDKFWAVWFVLAACKPIAFFLKLLLIFPFVLCCFTFDPRFVSCRSIRPPSESTSWRPLRSAVLSIFFEASSSKKKARLVCDLVREFMVHTYLIVLHHVGNAVCLEHIQGGVTQHICIWKRKNLSKSEKY